ncbi:MAG: 2-aminomuconate deaminase [Myxococcales bacterium]|nr:2-aminomuconate deaminase [Myxococcales bacterium]
MDQAGTTTEAYIFPDRPGALAHYPHARRVGNLLFLSGLSSRRPDNSHAGVTIHADGRIDTDIEVQTAAVIDNMRILLERCGSSLGQVVDLTSFLVDMADFPGYNRVYNAHFDAKTGPTRTTVAVHQLPHPNLRIEMKAVAFLDGAPP